MKINECLGYNSILDIPSLCREASPLVDSIGSLIVQPLMRSLAVVLPRASPRLSSSSSGLAYSLTDSHSYFSVLQSLSEITLSANRSLSPMLGIKLTSASFHDLPWYWEPWLEERGLGDRMSSEAVSTLLSSITEDEMSAFSKLWLGRNMGRKSILFDITSVSSYSSIPGVERGHNRDRENLEQMNLALLSTYDTKVPLTARRLNGSLSDVTVLRGMVEMRANA